MRLEFAHVSFAVTCLDACMKTLGIYLKSVHFTPCSKVEMKGRK